MAKKYIRKSGCLPNKDAQRLLMDIVAYRNATGSKAMYQKRKYSAGYAVFEVVTVPDEEPLENRSASE